MIDLLQAFPWLFVLAAGVTGLSVGSFLNVVIHRLPRMMQRDWQAQCRQLLELPAEVNRHLPSERAEPLRFNLIVPRSRCPQCGHLITALENIPLLSYLALKGKCSACGARISPRYPAVELLTAILSAAAAAHFGFTWLSAAALLFTWSLIALTFIDLEHQLLPDSITLPLLWGGLLLSITGVFVDSRDAIIGAVAGYLALWAVYWLFKLATGKEGMGQGDFKLLAMLGAWLGWQALPVVILLSSLVGAVVGLSMVLFLGRDKNIPIPFGPYLAAAGWLALIWGKELTDAYLHLAGLA
ncbi:MAG: prepilin peptidase [Gammaproteobacteria bacterium]|nr:MAG: prepilin peptidase [Gammaproteobacteria bacterium]